MIKVLYLLPQIVNHFFVTITAKIYSVSRNYSTISVSITFMLFSKTDKLY